MSDSDSDIYYSRNEEFMDMCYFGEAGNIEMFLNELKETGLEDFDINFVGEVHKVTPLMEATEFGHDEVVNVLVKAGANPDLINEYGRTALHIACEKEEAKASTVMSLLRAKPSLIIKNDLWETPVFNALLEGRDDFVEILLRYAMDLKISKAYYELVYNIFRGDDTAALSIIQKLKDVDFKNHGGESPLHFAVVKNRIEVVKKLLQRGANPNKNMVLKRRSVLIDAVFKGHTEVVNVLLQHKAEIQTEGAARLKEIVKLTIDTATPLFLAVYDNQVEILEMLLKSGGNASLPFECGFLFIGTPLHLACQKGLVLCVHLLLKYFVNVNIQNRKGETPLHLCKYNNPEIFEMLLANYADPNVADNEGRVPIHNALANGKVGIVKLLLKHRARVDIKDNKGQTILHYAAVCEKDSKPLEFILKSGFIVDVNVKDKSGNTALHLIKKNGCNNFLTLLLYGADINVQNKENEFPNLKCSQEKKNCPVYEYFEKLSLLGHPINDRVKSCLDELDSSAASDRKLILTNEIHALRSIIVDIDSETSLYDLLIDESKIEAFVGSETFLKVCENHEHDFQKKFPNYGMLLNIQNTKVIQKNKDFWESPSKKFKMEH